MSLPHPVLGRTDTEVLGKFIPESNILYGKEQTLIHVNFTLENKTITSLVSKGNAVFCLLVDCPSTRFVKTYTFAHKEIEVSIPTDSLRDKVSLEFYILANNNIKDYSPANVHKDYENYNFDIEKAEPIAIYRNKVWFIAEKSWENLSKVSSLMTVVDSGKEEGEVKYNLDKDKIAIELPSEDYSKWYLLRKDVRFPSILQAGIAFPALQHAIVAMQEGESEVYKNKKWYMRLQEIRSNNKRLAALDWEDSRIIPEICQIILEKSPDGPSPVSRMLNEIDEIRTKFLEGLE